MGGEVGPCESLLLQDRMLIGPVLHKCYAGNSSCFEFTGATAMSFLEDRKFHDTHQSTDSDTLYTVSCPWTLERAIYPSHLGRSVLNTSRQHLNSIVRGKGAFLSSLMSVSSQRSQSHQHCPKKCSYSKPLIEWNTVLGILLIQSYLFYQGHSSTSKEMTCPDWL